MSVPTAGRTHLVLVGATGMVGGYALRYALEHPAVEHVTAIGRRTLGISHAKLNEILHPNFGDCSALAESLTHRDAAIFCLGAYTGSASDAEFRTITVDYTVEFARVLHRSSPNADFAFLSGQGADPTCAGAQQLSPPRPHPINSIAMVSRSVMPQSVATALRLSQVVGH
jgi:nucleoside-diphosphate-sugar epimerase